MTKKSVKVNVESVEEMTEETEQEVEQVVEITSWDQLVEELPDGGFCKIKLKDGRILKFKVNGLTQPDLDEINKKYEKMLPKQPTKNLRNLKTDKVEKIPLTEGTEYELWKEKDESINRLRAGEMLIAFLPENMRPKVDPNLTGNEKIVAQVNEFNKRVVAGTAMEILQAGYEASGFNLDEKIEQAKN